MKIYERQFEILRLLNERRFETMGAMAKEFGVTTRTIFSDIVVLTERYTIKTTHGHNGGVSVGNDFHPFIGTLSVEETKALINISLGVIGEYEIMMLQKIISYYGAALNERQSKKHLKSRINLAHINKKMTEKGWSLSELAKNCGLSMEYIDWIMNGNPSEEILLICGLADAFPDEDLRQFLILNEK